ncbi:MAG: DciA family protein [Methylobacterium sp.]|uniref:DUF721 domain-containing protein n=1 Tax=Methylobacterium sp. TaxID=409 RepID=UPI0025DB490D|nr:DciA family protein [Methylobacterium sp.]MBX9930713.1 DciA family protein [Methylobacterium sp.]
MARVKPLAELIEACVGKAFAAQGFASTDIIAVWPDIVGERLARFCQPLKIEWPRGKRTIEAGRPEPGTLIVRVEGAFALELQHLVPVVIQRVNAHYGWACIGRIVMRQGRIERAARRPAPASVDPILHGQVSAAVSLIEDEALRDALDRLGVAAVATPHTARR